MIASITRLSDSDQSLCKEDRSIIWVNQRQEGELRNMPHTNSAKKRMRQSAKSQVRNRAAVSEIKKLRRTLLEAVSKKDVAASEGALKKFFSAADKACKRGMIRKNNCIRRKNRASALVRALKQAPAAGAS